MGNIRKNTKSVKFGDMFKFSNYFGVIAKFTEIEKLGERTKDKTKQSYLEDIYKGRDDATSSNFLDLLGSQDILDYTTWHVTWIEFRDIALAHVTLEINYNGKICKCHVGLNPSYAEEHFKTRSGLITEDDWENFFRDTTDFWYDESFEEFLKKDNVRILILWCINVFEFLHRNSIHIKLLSSTKKLKTNTPLLVFPDYENPDATTYYIKEPRTWDEYINEDLLVDFEFINEKVPKSDELKTNLDILRRLLVDYNKLGRLWLTSKTESKSLNSSLSYRLRGPLVRHAPLSEKEAHYELRPYGVQYKDVSFGKTNKYGKASSKRR